MHVLSVPVTPFTASGDVDLANLAEHVGKGVDAGPGGVFIAFAAVMAAVRE